MDLKRIILILGGKGGTGKTLFCRALYYFLVEADINVLGFDADKENPEFEEYHIHSAHKVELLDFLEVSEAKRFFTIIDEKRPDVAMMDMPGASGRQTREQIQKFGLFEIAKELGYKVTIATVLNNAYNTINSLDIMLQFCGNQADYVVVKSQLWNQGSLNFERWEKSETKKAFNEVGGIEIEMPVLDSSAFDVIHENQASFFNLEKVPFGDRILVKSFLNLSRSQIESAARYLGYPTQALDQDKLKIRNVRG